VNSFRTLLATLLAILIASPPCCCFGQAADGPARRSCCEARANSGGKEEPGKAPHACACKAKEPRDQVKNLELPPHMALLLEPVLLDLGCLSPPAAVPLAMAFMPHTGCDPPRLLLARYSRWLV